jgi:hypothetical protein
MLIHVTLTQEIFFEFNYYTGWTAPWNGKKRFVYYMKAILYTLFASTLVFLFVMKAKFSWDLLLFLLLLLLLYFAVIVPAWIKHRYYTLTKKFFEDPQNANIFLPTTIEISEKGVRSNDSISETNYGWPAFVRKASNKSADYLYLNKQLAIVIPERAFANKNEKEEFDKLLAEYLPLQAEFTDHIK